MKKIFNHQNKQKQIDNVINGNFKVIEPLKKEIKELMNTCKQVDNDHKKFNQLYEQDQKIYNQSISGSNSLYQTGLNMKR